MNLSIGIYIAIGFAAVCVAGGVYYHIYDKGAESEVIKQERKLDELKERTDEVQDRALTTSNPRDELRKYARPD